jgi:hypothetical protein
VANTKVERSGTQGGKGVGMGGGGKTVTTTYSYFANLAIGLCEGPVAYVGRVWADGRELDLTTLTMRLHEGHENQPADPLIVAKEGAANAPGYRGLAYVVFERLPLADFGNRVPQFAFEVIRPVDGLNKMIRAVCLIPGASEFGYDDTPVMRVLGLGKTEPENRHQMQRIGDVDASLDAMQALLPNLKRVSLVVSWFGNDLRAGSCTITPRVDVNNKSTDGAEWSVADLTREDAQPVSQVNGSPAYGGTPSDASVIRLIRNLRKRGLEVVLYPFVMMDVEIGNTLPDPYGGTGQAPYPWRGRITCHPAPGIEGSPDGTSGALAQVNSWFTRSWVLSPSRSALCPPRRGSGRRRRLHDRQRTYRPHARAFRIGRVPGRQRARQPCHIGSRNLAPVDKVVLWRGLDRVRRACTERRRGSPFPPRSIIRAFGHRCCRHRLLSAHFRLARWAEP